MVESIQIKDKTGSLSCESPSQVQRIQIDVMGLKYSNHEQY